MLLISTATAAMLLCIARGAHRLLHRSIALELCAIAIVIITLNLDGGAVASLDLSQRKSMGRKKRREVKTIENKK